MGQYLFDRWRLSASVVCRRRLSSPVTLPAGGPAGRPPGAWAVRLPTLQGGPVVLHPVRATLFYFIIIIILHGWLQNLKTWFKMLRLLQERSHVKDKTLRSRSRAHKDPKHTIDQYWNCITSAHIVTAIGAARVHRATKYNRVTLYLGNLVLPRHGKKLLSVCVLLLCRQASPTHPLNGLTVCMALQFAPTSVLVMRILIRFTGLKAIVPKMDNKIKAHYVFLKPQPNCECNIGVWATSTLTLTFTSWWRIVTF